MIDLQDLQKKHYVTVVKTESADPSAAWVAYSTLRNDSIRIYGSTRTAALCRWLNHREALIHYVHMPVLPTNGWFLYNVCWRMIRALWLQQHPDRRCWKLTPSGDLTGYKTKGWTEHTSPARAILATAQNWGIE